MANRNGTESANLLLVDIGNSRVGVARWSQGVRTAAHHLPNDPADAVADLIGQQWAAMATAGNRAVVVSSVCPPVLEELQTLLAGRGLEPFLVIGKDIDPPIATDLSDPTTIGADRLCVAAAAFAGFKCACVAADFGTALTVDLVADNGVFLGGTILPGMDLCAKALHEHTALLPLVNFEGYQNDTLGKDTRSAIRNGIFAMMIGSLREIAERYATQIGKWPPLVVTGGDAEVIAKNCDFVDRVVPDLCFDGLVLAYQQHVQQRQP